MAVSKNISDIIGVQNSCRDIIQELYEYELRPSESIREVYKNTKIDDALHFEIIEYDDFNETFSLSLDTEEYYKARLGHNDETNISLIDEKISKLEVQLSFYNKRMQGLESTEKETKAIYKILSQIPSLLKHNLLAITSSSIFAFKSEPNFEIKIEKLKICQDEIAQLVDASQSCDTFLKSQYNFFKAMHDPRINAIIIRLKRNSIEIEKSFIKLFDDIKNFINQTVKDGEFIKKLQRLKALKDDNQLRLNTNIEELAKKASLVAKSAKLKKIHPDDKILDYIDTIRKIIEVRKIEIKDTKIQSVLQYDITETANVKRKLYNYQKLNNDFLEQEENLVVFLLEKKITKDRLLGVFIRMIKNYSSKYEINENTFIELNNRKFIEVKRCL